MATRSKHSLEEQIIAARAGAATGVGLGQRHAGSGGSANRAFATGAKAGVRAGGARSEPRRVQRARIRGVIAGIEGGGAKAKGDILRGA